MALTDNSLLYYTIQSCKLQYKFPWFIPPYLLWKHTEKEEHQRGGDICGEPSLSSPLPGQQAGKSQLLSISTGLFYVHVGAG